MKKSLILSILFIMPFIGQAQINIKGKVMDFQSKGNLEGVIVKSKNAATTTDANGTFELKASKNDTLNFSIMSHEKQFFILENEESITILLKAKTNNLQEIIVKADRLSNLQTPGHLDIKKELLQKTHGLLEDPMQSVAKMPGVTRIGDLFTPSQLYIRGGSSDEILFLSDNTPISWPWYFGGQKSMFNTDIIKNIELITGGFSAAYGNYMSSVMNVSLKEGSFKETHGSFSIGIYNAQGYIETPLKKEKLSLVVAARSTYMDKILKNADFPTPSLFDSNIKLAYQLNSKNLLTFTNSISSEGINYQSKDDDETMTRIVSSGKKSTQSMIWQGQVSDKVYNKLIFTHNSNDDDYELDHDINMQIMSNTYGFRNDLTYFLNENKLVKAGIEGYSTSYKINGFESININFTDPKDPANNKYSYKIEDNLNRIGTYLLYEGKLLGNLQTNSGLRYDYNFNYSNVSPRIKLLYPFNNTSIHVAWGKYYQFADIGVKNADELPASHATHYILGIKQKINRQFSGWVEFYQKNYSDIHLPQNDGNYEATGVGKSKGIEFFVEKNQGKIQGWASYGFSHSQRTNAFDKKIYDANFDQRHILNTNIEWHINSKPYFPTLLQVNYRFETGRPYTPVVGAIQQEKVWYPIRGNINSIRYDNYNNLNLRIEWMSTMKKNRVLKGYFEVWNVLDAKNPITINTKYGSDFPNAVKQTFNYAYQRLFGGGVIFTF